MDIIDPSQYRPCVGIALFNKQGQVFIAERSDISGAWQMPQGGIDANEDVIAAAKRELEEETGIIQAEVIAVKKRPVFYNYPPEVQKKMHNVQYLGQLQHWVAMRFLGTDDDITLDAHTQIEFVNWRWSALEDILGATVDFKKEVYRAVIDEFAHLKI